MCANIDRHAAAGEPVAVFRAFRCCALDTITSFCFARNVGATNAPGFRDPIERAMDVALPLTAIFKHFPIVQNILSALPPDVAVFLNPELSGFVNLRKVRSRLFSGAWNGKLRGGQALDVQVHDVLHNPDALAHAPHKTVYHAFLAHEPVPSEAELRDEALVYVHAGTDTSSDALAAGTLHVLDSPAIHARLRAELDAAWPRLAERPRWEDLEALPYLVRPPAISHRRLPRTS